MDSFKQFIIDVVDVLVNLNDFFEFNVDTFCLAHTINSAHNYNIDVDILHE